MSASGKRRVAVLGAGQSALTAALQLTDPSNPAAADTEVTIYQLGWRLGGKGATGRPSTPPALILEHGLHQWYGFYDNSFSQIRAVYDELDRPPGAPLATWTEAFEGTNELYLIEWIEDQPLKWRIVAPTLPGSPGGGPSLLTAFECVARAIERVEDALASSPLAELSHEHDHVLARVHSLLNSAVHRHGHEDVPAHTARRLLRAAARIVRDAADDVTDPIVHEIRDLLHDLESDAPAGHATPAWMRAIEDGALGAACGLLWHVMKILWSAVHKDISTLGRTIERRLWITANLAYACIAGSARDGVFTDGFDVINDRDLREWLGSCAYPDGGVMLRSPMIEAVYVGAFAYPDGNTHGDLDVAPAENFEAGTGLRGIVRTFLTYRGSLCYRFLAGTGDTSYAPIYEVLRARGVDVRFFSRVERVELQDGRIARVHVAEQAQVVESAAYEPLVDIDGLPCWPREPAWEQLVDGDWLRDHAADFEWPSDVIKARERPIVLEDGRDFDDVVLGISIAALPPICGDLVDAYPTWATALERIKTVRTQSLQVWLDEDAIALGFPIVSTQGTSWRYDDESSLNVWADYSELIAMEQWPTDRRPRSLAYFTSTMPEEPDFADQEAANDGARENAVRLLREGLPILLPGVLDADGEFRWDLLVSPGGEAVSGPDRLKTQWIRGNVLPTERYVLSVVDSSRYRLPVHDPAGPANLYLAGDWTLCTLNCGCMEAATMSGMLCSNALSGYPERDAIVGIDF